jgi:hypothetical protein
MNEVYNYYLARDDIKRIERLELFDEFEEWNMIQAHYHISMASNHNCFNDIAILGRQKKPQATTQASRLIKPLPTNINGNSKNNSNKSHDQIDSFYPKVDISAKQL